MWRLKNLYYFFLDILNKIAGTIISAIKILLFSKFWIKDNFQKGQNPLVILGTGPSLATDLPLLLKNVSSFDIICINDYPFNKDFILTKPKIYTLIDPLYWRVKKNQNEIIKYTGKEIIDRIIKTADWTIYVYLPRDFYATLDKEVLKNNPCVRFTIFNRISVTGFATFKHLFYKLNLGIPHCQNVINLALFLGLKLGYKKIYLLGADHSWHQQLLVDEWNQTKLKQIHYDEDKTKLIAQPVIKSINDNGQIKPFTISELFFAWAKVFEEYTATNNYAHSLNAKIINCSNISFIDAFERGTLDA